MAVTQIVNGSPNFPNTIMLQLYQIIQKYARL